MSGRSTRGSWLIGLTEASTTAMAYPLLAVSCLLAAVDRRWAPHGLAPVVCAAGCALATVVLLRHLSPALVREARDGGTAPAGLRRWYAAAYVTLLVLIAVLVHLGPLFGVFAFSGYLFHLPLPRRAQYPAIAVTAVLTASSQAGGLPPAPTTSGAVYVGLIAVNLGVALAMTWAGRIGEERSQRRQQLVSELSEANRQLEQALAENTGLHGQLLVQAREAGVLDERQRLAQEIHDTLAQGLIGIITQLQAAERAPTDQQRKRHLDTAQELARDSLSEARRSVRALRPQALDDTGLAGALDTAVRRWSTTSGVSASTVVTGTAVPLPAQVEVALLRTAQEAMSNIARHAKATRAGITLSYMPDLVTLDVRDDGIGLPAGLVPGAAASPAATPRTATNQASTPVAGPADGGYGMVSMRQRIESLGGTLTLESEPGLGTAVSAMVAFTVPSPHPIAPHLTAPSPHLTAPSPRPSAPHLTATAPQPSAL